MPDGGGKWLARAKINLFLHVTGRRPDGYHCLHSLVVFTDLGDVLTVAPSEDLTLSISGPFADDLACEDDNLVLRAARLLAEAAGIEARARIHLEKVLPVAAGIGGGSADAAATILALCDLWRIEMSDRELRGVAARLGADVPVCLNSRPSLISGIGHDIAPVRLLPPFALLLVNANQALATAEVFNQLAKAFAPSTPWPKTPVSDLAAALATTRNDLEPPARQLAPVIVQVLESLTPLPGCRLARMSGSGATCFGLFDSITEARAAASTLTDRQPDWWVEASSVAGLSQC